MARRNLASLELLLRTLQNQDTIAMQRTSQRLEGKRLDLELTRLHEGGKRQTAELRLKELEGKTRAAQVEAATHMQKEELKLRSAQVELSSAQVLAQTRLAFRGFGLQMWSAIKNEQHNLRSEDLARMELNMKNNEIAQRLIPHVGGLIAGFEEDLKKMSAGIDGIFVWADPDSGEISMHPQFEAIADAYRKTPGFEGADDQMIATQWSNNVRRMYRDLADDKAKELGYPSIDELNAKEQNDLVRESVRLVFGGGPKLRKAGLTPILHTAAEGVVDSDKLNAKKAEFQKANPTGWQNDYDGYLMSHIQIGTKDDNFAFFNRSAPLNQKGWNSDEAMRIVDNIDAYVSPGLTDILPGAAKVRNNLSAARNFAGNTIATASLDMARTANMLRQSTDGTTPIDMNALMSDLSNAGDASDMNGLVSGVIDTMNSYFIPAITKDETKVKDKIDTGLTPPSGKAGPIGVTPYSIPGRGGNTSPWGNVPEAEPTPAAAQTQFQSDFSGSIPDRIGRGIGDALQTSPQDNILGALDFLRNQPIMPGQPSFNQAIEGIADDFQGIKNYFSKKVGAE